MNTLGFSLETVDLPGIEPGSVNRLQRESTSLATIEIPFEPLNSCQNLGFELCGLVLVPMQPVWGEERLKDDIDWSVTGAHVALPMDHAITA